MAARRRKGVAAMRSTAMPCRSAAPVVGGSPVGDGGSSAGDSTLRRGSGEGLFMGVGTPSFLVSLVSQRCSI